ncbi:MAG: hypothetical protein AB7N61_12375 [Acidimicrobiia bacterium]
MELQAFVDHDDIESNLQPGGTGWLGGCYLWVWDEGELTEIWAGDHPDVEHLGRYYCDDEEINAGSNTDTIGDLWRVGNLYFAAPHDRSYEDAFEAASIEQALDHLAPAMGIEIRLTGYTRK